MLVVLLILFTNVLADDDKYVDLLPDAEKQLFIENVARRILKDVESQENATTAESGELSDEQLKKHNEYVKAVLKEEADYVRRSKGEPTKERELKSGEKSEEKGTLAVKPLETEKIALPDDLDIEQVDLTLRNDRRGGIGISDDSTTDYIKVEIVTDNAPIIKRRSVQNDASYSDSESEELTSEKSKRINSRTEETNEVETTITEKSKNLISTTENANVITTTTAESKLVEITTVGLELTESKSEISEKGEPVVERTEYRDTKTIEPTEVKTKIKDTEITESTTTGTKNKETEERDSGSSNSSETEEESVHVKYLEKPNSQTLTVDSNESPEKTTESTTKTSEMEYFGIKSKENKSNEYNSVASGDIEEFTTITSPVDRTTTNSVPTTQNMDEITELSTPTTYTTKQKDDSYIKKHNNITTESSTKSTLTSTLTDEGTTELVTDITTDLVTETSTYNSSTEMLRTQEETSTATSTTESTLKPVAITEEMQITVEDFTSAPTVKTTIRRTTNNESNKKNSDIKQRAIIESKQTTTNKQGVDKESKEATTKKVKIKPKIHKHEKAITGPKKKRDDAKAKELKERQLKYGVIDEGVDKNFIELEKVYYDNNYKVQTGKGYRVYEIPAGKSPFLPDEQFMKDQPYHIPTYNYSPNNAYFNPINRLGPNPEDTSKEEVGAFTVADDTNDVNPPRPFNENLETQNYDMEYSDTAFGNKRKKFGNKENLSQSIHKMPQQNNSQVNKKRGKVNPEDYSDSDHYFGKIRKDLERRVNHNNYDLFPNSNEGEHPAHSIQEMSLKDHVRAVRNILFQQKFFGIVNPDRQGKESEIFKRKKHKEEKLKKNTKHNADPGNLLINNGDDKNKYEGNNNNIALNNYFGTSKASQPTAILTSNDKKGRKNDDHFQKVGYLKNLNNTKELYVMDQFFKDNVVKYIHELKTKDSTYKKADLIPATHFPMSKNDIQRDLLITKFQGEEKNRNAEIMKNSQKYNTSKKTGRFTNKNDKVEIPKKVLNTVKGDKIESIKKFKIIRKDNVTLNSPKQELNLRLDRRNDVVRVGVYLQVLKDMISLDNKALRQYDWLGTTVDIQAALQKLFDLTSLVVNEEDIHPADMEILKYILFQQKLAVEIIEANNFGAQLRKKLLPRNKKKKVKHNMLKEKGLINRVWLYLRREVPEGNENGALKNLNKFLINVEDRLFDLHVAIKNVAKITKYKNQHWYRNLKELYLTTDDKHLLELLLHMTVSRLFGLIEESAKNGLEDDYVQYMKKNKSEAKKTLEEVLFAIQIMDEINKIVE